MVGERLASTLRILVVDDDEKILNMLVTYLRKHGWNVDRAATVAAAREQIGATSYDILVLDQQLPDGNGLELAEELIARDHDSCVVLMTAYASVRSAVDALRVGLADYLVKPFPSLELVHSALLRVAETLELRRRNRRLVDELQAQKDELEGMVVRDPLTGLFNHHFFHDTLERELSRGMRHDVPLSVVLIDIDGMERLNSIGGHGAGDALLTRFGELLSDAGPHADSTLALRRGDMAARYAGNTFALVLTHTDKRGAASKAEAIRVAVARGPLNDVCGEPVSISAGVAGFPEDASTRGALMHAAEVALRAAKVSGRNRICTYTPALRDGPSGAVLDSEAIELRSALDETIAQSALAYHFQPIHHANGGGVYGFEALVRPQHPSISNPFVLFDTAEHAGRITELGRVVRGGALANIGDLPFPFTLFVNLHPYELNDPTLLDLAPEVDEQRARIVFEITETTAIQNTDRVNRRINELRERGYRIAIDDLGSGYAGLLALSRLTPDFVKLDRELVQRVSTDERTSRLVRHVVDFANGEGISVVAEGIETDDELERVEELGCGLLQGYLLGRPGPGFAT